MFTVPVSGVYLFMATSIANGNGAIGVVASVAGWTHFPMAATYSASKAASDHLVLAWKATYGFPVLLSNCSNNYGYFHFPEKLIPLVTLNALEEKPLPVYGKGNNVRDWCMVSTPVMMRCAPRVSLLLD